MGTRQGIAPQLLDRFSRGIFAAVATYTMELAQKHEAWSPEAVVREGGSMKRPLPPITRVLRLSMIAIAMLMGAFSGISFAAEETNVALLPGAGAPDASGTATIGFDETVLVGKVEVEHLRSQPFGSGHFYGVWFVRTDTGDKAFLGALINDESIILADGGRGHIEFRATHFTTGPNAGSPITFGTSGDNLILVLIENLINGLTPSPIGPVPGTGEALGGTF